MVALVGNSTNKCLKILDKILRTLSRVILRVKKSDPIANRIKNELNWLFIKEMYEYRLLLYVYKYYHNEGNSSIFSQVQMVQSRHAHDTRRGGDLVCGFIPRSHNGARSAQYNASRLWNNLPLNIKQCDSYHKFKSALYNFYIKKNNN